MRNPIQFLMQLPAGCITHANCRLRAIRNTCMSINILKTRDYHSRCNMTIARCVVSKNACDETAIPSRIIEAVLVVAALKTEKQ